MDAFVTDRNRNIRLGSFHSASARDTESHIKQTAARRAEEKNDGMAHSTLSPIVDVLNAKQRLSRAQHKIR